MSLLGKLTLSLLTLSASIECVYASDKMGDEHKGSYVRPGTSFVVNATEGQESEAVKKVVEKNHKTIAPEASIKDLDSYFCGKPCSVTGPINDIFNMYEKAKGDLTIASDASKLMPKDHVLAVHKFEQTTTEEGEAAIIVQNARTANNAPIDYKGVLKYQNIEEKVRFNINVLFDLTGKTNPKVSVVKDSSQDTQASDDFQKELESVQTSKLHVAIYAPEGSTIPTSNGNVMALRRKITLDKK